MPQSPTFKPSAKQSATWRKRMWQENLARKPKAKQAPRRKPATQAERDEIADYLARNPPRVW